MESGPMSENGWGGGSWLAIRGNGSRYRSHEHWVLRTRNRLQCNCGAEVDGVEASPA